MKGRLRNFIRSRPMLYKGWLFLRFGYPHRFPDRHTDLLIEGYQRSGNTFATYLTRMLFPDKKIVAHFHAIASVKSAFRFGVPVLIVVREPKEAIASSMVKRVYGRGFSKSTAISYDLAGYINFYEFVLANADNVTVIFFDDFIGRPSIIAERAARLLCVDVPGDDTVNDCAASVYSDLKADTRSSALNALGNPEKDELKNKLLSEVREDAMYRRAEQVFDLMIERFRT